MNAFVEQLGWVLVHSLWQFAVVALLAAVARRAMRHRSAGARYGVFVGAMALMIVSPAATWMLHDDSLSEQASRRALAPGQVANVEHSPVANAHRLTNSPNDERGVGSLVFRNSPQEDDPTSQRQSGEFRKTKDPTPQPNTGGLTPAARQILLSWSQRAQTALRPWLTWIVAVWSLGVVICSLRPLLGWHTLWRLKRVGVSPVSDDITTMLRRVAERLGVRRAVSVLQSTLAQVPVVVGYARPVILLPLSLLTSLPAEQLEAILAHELAHVRRHDFVVNLLQTLVETIFFYHPAVWWLSRQIRIEREHCCDDLVVASFGNRVEYGRALLAIEELRGHGSVLALGVADGSLLSRIRRIVGLGSEPVANERWSGVSVSLMLALCALSLTWCFAMRPGSPMSEEELNPFLLKASDGIEVELLGVSTQWAQPNALKEPKLERRSWWRPDGTATSKPPVSWMTLSALSAVRPKYFDDWPTVAVIIRGSQRGSQEYEVSHPVILIDGMPESTGVSAFGPNQGRFFRNEVLFCGPSPGLKSGIVRVAIGRGEYGPWRITRPNGAVETDGSIPAELQSAYEWITPVEFREVEGQTRLIYQPQPTNDSTTRARVESELLDVDGQPVPPGTNGDVNGEHGTTYPIPLARVSHYRVRLQAFRNWFTFENVSFQPGHKTDVKASVGATPELRRDPFAATLPNGARVEFVGLAPMKVEPKAWWKPDGSLLNEVPLHDKGTMSVSGQEMRRALIRVHGEGVSYLNVTTPGMSCSRRDETHSSGGPFVRVDGGYAFPASRKSGRIEIGIATQPQSPTRRLDAKGRRIVQGRGVNAFSGVEGLLVVDDVTRPDRSPLTNENPLPDLGGPIPIPGGTLIVGDKKLNAGLYDRLLRSRPGALIVDLPPSDASEFQILDVESTDDIEVLSVGIPPLRQPARVNGQPVMSAEKEADNVVLRQQTQFNWRAPKVAKPMDVDLVLIDVDGQEHHPVETGLKISEAHWAGDTHWGKTERHHRFNVPLDRVAGFEYRVRSYQHWVTFDNVSLHPGEMTDVKVSTETIAASNPVGKQDVKALSGEIVWVDEANRLAWISLGDDDSAKKQMRFQVRAKSTDGAPADAADVKGMVEISRTVSRHVSEVRIVEEVLSNPIVKGDVVNLLQLKPVKQPVKGEYYDGRIQFGTERIKPSTGRTSPTFSGLKRNAPAHLKLLEVDGSQAQSNHVVLASVGFPGKSARVWFESANKDGLISLEKLPAGTHWLAAAGDSHLRTVFSLRMPTGQAVVEQRLRNARSFVDDDDIVADATIAGESPDDEVITVWIENESTDPIWYSAEDISLTTFRDSYRIYLPRSRVAAKPEDRDIELPPGSSAGFQFKWHQLVRTGLWASRGGEAIDEPWSLESRPGKIQIAVYLGNRGIGGGFVTEPQTILDRPIPPSVDERINKALDQPVTLTITDTSWTDVIADISKQHRVPFVIDVEALTDLNISLEKKISLSVRDVKLREALGQLLEQVGGKLLGFVVEDDVLKITAVKTLEAAEAKQRIEAELRNTTDIAFLDTPLSDVISYLSEYHDISIQLHPSAQGAAETRITGTLSGFELADVLGLILHEAKLSSCIDHGVLLIATPEEIRKRGGPFPRSLAADFAKLEKADASVRWSALLRGVVEESDSAAIPKLTELLGSDDVVVQRFTARALVPFGNKAQAAQPGLEKLTGSKEGSVAYAAWRALIEIGREDFSTLPFLLSALDREDKTLTERWSALFWQFDPKVWHELATKYPTLTVPARRTLTSTLIRDPGDSLPFLISAVSDADIETRRRALRQPLIDLDTTRMPVEQQKDFETALLPRLKDSDVDCRVLAAGQLVRLNRSVDLAVDTILAEASSEPGREALRRCVASTRFLYLFVQHQLDERCRSETEATRNAARQALAVICRHYQTTRSDHFIMWGPNRGGLQTRLSPLTEKPQVGQPINLKLELINQSNPESAKFTFAQPARCSLVVIGPDGREMSPINRERKPSETTVTAEPYKPVVLIEELDLAAEYPIKQPGTYLVQWTQDLPGAKSDDGKSLTPNSNVLTVEVAEPTEMGGLKPIQGEVIDSVTGKPIEGATVRFRFGKLQDGLRSKGLAELVFRNVGRFTFELPEAVKGPTDLFVERTAEHPDYQTSGPGAVPLHLLFNKEPNHAHDFIRKVELVPGKIISGQVLGLDGRPAKGIEIFSGRNRQGWQPGSAHKTTTDANGRYRLAVPDGDRGRIYVIPNHAAGVSRAITPEFGEQPVFQLLRGTRLFGQLTDAKGRGVANVVVRADGGERVPWRYAMSDADGKYSLPPCQYGSYTVELIDEGWMQDLERKGARLPDVFLPQKVELPKTAPTERPLDFQPVSSVRVTARYTTSDNQPVSGRTLTLQGHESGVAWQRAFREMIDQPGHYELQVPSGSEGRIQQDVDGQGFLRIIRDAPDSSPTSPWSMTKFDKDGKKDWASCGSMHIPKSTSG